LFEQQRELFPGISLDTGGDLVEKYSVDKAPRADFYEAMQMMREEEAKYDIIEPGEPDFKATMRMLKRNAQFEQDAGTESGRVEGAVASGSGWTPTVPTGIEPPSSGDPLIEKVLETDPREVKLDVLDESTTPPDFGGGAASVDDGGTDLVEKGGSASSVEAPQQVTLSPVAFVGDPLPKLSEGREEK
jgi:hypothetical protein